MFDHGPDHIIGFAWMPHSSGEALAGKGAAIVDERGTDFPLFCIVVPNPEGGYTAMLVEMPAMNYSWAEFEEEEEAMRAVEMYALDWLVDNGLLPPGVIGAMRQ